MSKMSRTKGAVVEREVIAILHAHGWLRAQRTSDGRAQSSRGDVTGGPAGCHLEIKRQERLNVPAALSQAIRDAGLDVPVVVHRPSRHEWMATLPLDELLPLLALRERS
jgi:hypothetical protein